LSGGSEQPFNQQGINQALPAQQKPNPQYRAQQPNAQLNIDQRTLDQWLREQHFIDQQTV
jgi:hypothetical protein